MKRILLTSSLVIGAILTNETNVQAEEQTLAVETDQIVIDTTNEVEIISDLAVEESQELNDVDANFEQISNIDVEKDLELNDVNLIPEEDEKSASEVDIQESSETEETATDADEFLKADEDNKENLLSDAKQTETSLDPLTTMSSVETPSNSDYEEILHEKTTSFQGTINHKNYGIDSKPWGTEGSYTYDQSDAFLGAQIRGVKEAVTAQGTFVLIQGSGINGWIDKQALVIESIRSRRDLPFVGQVVRSWHTIDTQPWGTEGYEYVAITTDLLGKTVYGMEEAITDRGTFVLIRQGNIQGWVDKKALVIESIQSQKELPFVGQVARGWHTIDTQPWGTEGYEYVASTSDLLGKTVYGLEEAVTDRGTFVLIRQGNIQGWVDKKALTIESIKTQKELPFVGQVARGWHTIDTQPWGTEGYQYVAITSDLLGKTVYGFEEAVTDRGTFVLIRQGNIRGWVDKKALEIEAIQQSKNISYQAKLKHTWNTIDTQPWGTEGFQKIGLSKDYADREITVLKEASTQRGGFIQFKINGTDIQGWVDKDAIERIEDTSNIPVKTHTVVAGDYLWLIANTYGVTVQNLIDWNNRPDNYVYVGEKLYVANPQNNSSTNPDYNDPQESRIVYIDALATAVGKQAPIIKELQKRT